MGGGPRGIRPVVEGPTPPKLLTYLIGCFVSREEIEEMQVVCSGGPGADPTCIQLLRKRAMIPLMPIRSLNGKEGGREDFTVLTYLLKT